MYNKWIEIYDRVRWPACGGWLGYRHRRFHTAIKGGMFPTAGLTYPWPKGEMKYRQQCTRLSWMFLAVEATLVPEVLLELLVDVVHHRLPSYDTNTPQGRSLLWGHSCTMAHDFLTTVRAQIGLASCTLWGFIGQLKQFDPFVPLSVVYSISKPRRVHDGEFQFHTFLFYIHRVFGDFYSLCDSL